MNKRLIKLAEMVDKNSIVCDVGTDHAFLPIYLVLNNISPLVYAIDNKKGPLSKAIENINNNHLEKNIIPILSDGLKNVDYDFDTLTISGMGGELIVDIIKEKDLRNKTLILEANNNQTLLRKYLMDNNFVIIDEVIVCDHNIYYQIIKAKYNYNQIKYNDYELTYGPINLKNKPKELKELIILQLSILEKALLKATSKDEINEKINFLKGVLEKYDL